MNHSTAFSIQKDWLENPRWSDIRRDYTPEDVDRLRGSLAIEHTIASLGAERLWHLLHKEDYVQALGALTGNQAIQQVRAGLQAIYLSGWQVAADAPYRPDRRTERKTDHVRFRPEGPGIHRG